MPPTILKQNTLTGFSTASPHPNASHPRYFYQWQTCFLVKVQHWRKKKMSRLPWHFLPFTFSVPSLCSAISIQAADSQPGPLPSLVPARKSRLQRENVINSMERKHRLSIIHVPLCCYLWLSFSTHSKWLGQGWPALRLSSSPCYLCLRLTSVFYRIATCTLKHTPSHMDAGGLSQPNPKYSDRLESSRLEQRGYRELCCRRWMHVCLHADASINKQPHRDLQRKMKLVQRACFASNKRQRQ